jgi:hypothetical protein
MAWMTSAGVASSRAMPGPNRLRQRDALHVAREDATAGRDDGRVIVRPRRARQGEEPSPLGDRARGLGIRIEEDVAMVEGCDQPQAFGQQHAVAEDVARHVADADRAYGIARDVDVHLGEMASHRLPGAARRNAHGLVVIAMAAARGEGIAEPMAFRDGDGIGRVREGRGALVGRDHQIGVVRVVAHGVGRRHDLAVDDIVGHVEQGLDEHPVALRPLGEPGLPVARRRQALGEEAALGADRHDHGILDLLRLDEAQDLGAEILRPVGPAQAAAGDVAEAQVQALDARTVDEDLVERPGQRQPFDFGAGELEGHRLAGEAVRAELKEARAPRRADEIDEAVKDAILVEARDLRELRLDLGADRGLPLVAVVGGARIEAGIEERHDAGRDGRMAAQGRRQIVLPVADADLPLVAAERPQQRHVPPAERRLDHQAIVGIRFGEPAGDRHQRRLQRPAQHAEVDRAACRALERHVVQPDPLRVPRLLVDPVGPLVDHREAEILEGRHTRRERQRHAAREDLEVDALERVAGAAHDVDGARPLGAEPVQDRDVGDGVGGAEAVAIADRERLRIGVGEGPRPGAVHRLLERVAQAVAPGPGELRDAGLDRLRIDGGRRLVETDDVMCAGQRPVRIIRIGGRQPAVEGLHQIAADAAAQHRVVALLREIGENRDEASERVGADQRADARPLRQGGDRRGETQEEVRVDLEELVARIGLEHVGERPAGVARSVEPGPGDHLGDLAAQVRNGGGRRRVDARREKADEAHLAGQGAVVGEELDPDHVEIGPLVDARPDAGLGDQQGRGAAQEGADLGSAAGRVLAAEQFDGGVAQQAEPGQNLRALILAALMTVDPQTQDHHVAVAEPVQECGRFRDLGGFEGRGQIPHHADGFREAVPHGGFVVGRDRDIGEETGQPLDQSGPVGVLVETVEMDVDEAFAASVGGGRRDGHHLPVGIAFDAEDRMGDETRLEPLLAEFEQRRIEEIGAVVVDDVEDRQIAPPIVPMHGDVGEGDPRRPPGVSGRREMLMCQHGDIGERGRRITGEIFTGDPVEEAVDEIRRDCGLAGGTLVEITFVSTHAGLRLAHETDLRA